MADVALAAGWMCAVCRARVDIAEPMVWRCPNATGVDRHHYLQLVHSSSPLVRNDSENPFVAFRRYLAWDSYAAAALGFTPAAREALIIDLDHRVAAVAGSGFRFTPFDRADALSDALGFKGDGGIWVKDETNNVAGSNSGPRRSNARNRASSSLKSNGLVR